MSILVEDISKFYGEQKALDKVSFSIQKGEIVGFLGPNGAGKSTLMKILTGYLPFAEGKAAISEIPVSEDLHNIQKKIGYLPEHNPLYTEMYVREYLKFNAKIHKTPDASIEEVIKLTGLFPEANKKIEQLSKGYRQRVGLAAALLHGGTNIRRANYRPGSQSAGRNQKFDKEYRKIGKNHFSLHPYHAGS